MEQALERKNWFQRVIQKVKDTRQRRKDKFEAKLAAMEEWERKDYLENRKALRKAVLITLGITALMIVFIIFFKELMIFIAIGLMCLGELFGGKGLPG